MIGSASFVNAQAMARTPTLKSLWKAVERTEVSQRQPAEWPAYGHVPACVV